MVTLQFLCEGRVHYTITFLPETSVWFVIWGGSGGPKRKHSIDYTSVSKGEDKLCQKKKKNSSKETKDALACGTRGTGIGEQRDLIHSS